MEQDLETPQKHFVNRVTPLSKLLALMLFVALPILTLYLGYREGIQSAKSQETQLISDLSTPGSDSSGSGIGYDTVVQGSFTGTYAKVDRLDEAGTTTCHTFTITDGHPAVISFYKENVEGGNTVNSITSDGKLRVNLPWDSIPDYVKTRLESGSETTLELIKKKATYTGAGACYSVFAFAGMKSP